MAKAVSQSQEQTPIEHFARLLNQLTAPEWQLLDLSFGLSNGAWHSPKQISQQQLLPLPAKQVKHQRRQLIHSLAKADITGLESQSEAINKLQQELYFRTNNDNRINRYGAILLLIDIANHQENQAQGHKLHHKLRKLKPK